MLKFSKKSNLKTIFLCFFLTSIILFSAIRINNMNTPISKQSNNDIMKSPNLSANELIIITPENITYTEPMSGYYPATYGFENDDIGSNPKGWYIEESGATLDVIGEIDGHAKVVRLDEGSSAEGWDGIYYSLSTPLTYGTIEFYWMFDSIQNEIYSQTRDSTGNNVGMTFGVFTSYVWRYVIAGLYYDLPNVDAPQANHWYKIRLDFRFTGAPAYMGLNQHKYNVTIDGINSGEIDIKSESSDLNSFFLGTGTNCANVKVYYDAIGYSWDPNYNIGDNLNEGLLLSYANSTSLDWVGYSLDGLANKTILGNTTIPMPADGLHSIQVFGNNSGIMYESDIRYFTVDTSVEPPTPPTSYINIITPENTTYTEPMSGLLLSYESNLNLDWIGYSLDGQANITILGNTTIPIPADGPHSIQAFGNDSLGVMYESNIRYFTIDTHAPVISGIDSIIELELDSSYIIDWIITDISGGTYNILKNASIESAGTFENIEIISINVDTSESGYLIYTLIAQDVYNKTSSHTVIVKIISQEEPSEEIPGFNVIILFPVTIIAIGVIIKFKYKNKK